MTSRTIYKKKISSTRTRRTKRQKGLICSRSSSVGGETRSSTSSSVSDKLIALKSLIPTQDRENIVQAEQLFQETANYIVRLKAQVFVLQRLLDLYGSNDDQIVSAAAAAAVL